MANKFLFNPFTGKMDIVPDISGKLDSNNAITGATKTKITYDTKGLITSGADATCDDIADGTNTHLVTTAQKTIIGNTSNTNSGDETTSTIKTKLGITTLSGSNTGDQTIPTTLASFTDDATHRLTTDTEKSTWNGKQNAGTYSTDIHANITALNAVSGTNTGDQTLPIDATISTTDVTTNNASTSKHGWFPKLPASTGKYLKDDLTWGTPAGASGGTPALTLGTTNTAGVATTFIRDDDTILAFDATSPSTQAFGDTAVVGTATVAARRDHKHAMMAAPTTITGNAGTATKLAATKTINGVAFDGSGNITIPSDITPSTSGNLMTSNGSAWTSAAPPSNADTVDGKHAVELAPTGGIMPYAGATAPTGWLLADGSAVSRTTYSVLFAIIGTTYGVGDNSTTFNLPDLKGRVPVGKSTDTEFDVLGETGGEKTHQLTIPEIPSHNHLTRPGANTDWGAYTPAQNQGALAECITFPLAINGGSTGGDGAHNNIQPYITLNYIIKY